MCSLLLAYGTIVFHNWIDGIETNSYMEFCLKENIKNLSANLGIVRTFFVSYVALNSFFGEVLVCYLFNSYYKFKNLKLIEQKYRECRYAKRENLKRCKQLIYNIPNDVLKGELLAPQWETLKSFSVGHYEFSFDLKMFRYLS